MLSEAIQSHTSESKNPNVSTEDIIVLETQLDDLNPQIIGYLFDRLFEVGALDVFTQGIGMKKSRPGLLLSIICFAEAIEACEHVIFQETTTLGIRRRQQTRSLLHRDFHPVETEYGTVSVKVASYQSGTPWINVKPEYEDCARLAQQHQVSWNDVHQAALITWQQQYGHSNFPGDLS
ncbi:MAG: LarC family nickel insertion protein [Merismopedia sp. SIO2A8]|nr:LarC family nickel insertion protein [Merismopedia sp. SIO2A8]